jgi:hypothetical protein
MRTRTRRRSSPGVGATSGPTASDKLGQMILPRIEQDRHGAEVVGMLFFDDNA